MWAEFTAGERAGNLALRPLLDLSTALQVAWLVRPQEQNPTRCATLQASSIGAAASMDKLQGAVARPATIASPGMGLWMTNG